MTPRRYLLPALLASSVLLTTACTTGIPETTANDETPALGHVHAMSFTSAGDLVVGSHHGVYSIDLDDGNADLVGDVIFDAMGMTLNSDDVYVSGHPGAETDDVFVAPNIGLAQYSPTTGWESVALAGQTDFHGLAATPADPDLIVGLPADRPALAVSTDGGTTWSDAAEIEARDVIIDAADPDRIMATTADGPLISRDGGAVFTPMKDAPLLVVITSDPGRDGGFLGIDAEGAIWSGSTEEEQAHERLGHSTGNPSAIARDPDSGTIAVADGRGIAISTDEGDTWNVLLQV